MFADERHRSHRGNDGGAVYGTDTTEYPGNITTTRDERIGDATANTDQKRVKKRV